jgi:hypothetical protein
MMPGMKPGIGVGVPRPSCVSPGIGAVRCKRTLDVGPKANIPALDLTTYNCSLYEAGGRFNGSRYRRVIQERWFALGSSRTSHPYGAPKKQAPVDRQISAINMTGLRRQGSEDCVFAALVLETLRGSVKL